MNAIVVPLRNPAARQDNRTNNPYVDVFFDKSHGILWHILASNAPRRITPQLLSEIHGLQQSVTDSSCKFDNLKFQVFSSEIPDIFSLGGDLAFFIKCAKNKDRAELRKYGYSAIDISYARITNFNKPITTISLVKGSALGGGFEAALAANYLIAEEQATFSFPETRFGLFPAHGAFTFLRQRLPAHIAEEIIYSGRTYTASELYKMGIVDQVCPKGEGDASTVRFARHRLQQHDGIHALRQMVQKYAPIDRDELYGIVDHWVDTVMTLNDKQLRIIEALSKTS